jgi:hypothetical protein
MPPAGIEVLEIKFSDDPSKNIFLSL